MVIRELSRTECLEVLAGTRIARLACARDNQPYVVPVYLVYSKEGQCLYGFTTFGKKLDWMRTNPQVCVEVDEINTNDQWVSVIVMGHYQELTEIDESDAADNFIQQRAPQVNEIGSPLNAVIRQSEDEQDRAWQLLQVHPEWWEPGSAAWVSRVHLDPIRSYEPVYYKISIVEITGHEASRNPLAGNVNFET